MIGVYLGFSLISIGGFILIVCFIVSVRKLVLASREKYVYVESDHRDKMQKWLATGLVLAAFGCLIAILSSVVSSMF